MAGPRTTELLLVLEELISVLQNAGEQHWCRWIVTCRNRLERSDYSGIHKLLAAYGGMGSFSDLVLTSSSSEEQLRGLRRRAWVLAEAIRMEYERGA